MAFQSVIMLVVVTHTGTIVDAGILTLAYANGNLFLNIGKYGMRNFQVSDTDELFGFQTYLRSRAITCSAMLCVGICQLAVSATTIGYSCEKSLVVLVMLIFKVVDAIEDVYHGNYQQHGHLDIGARFITYRLSSTITLFAILTLISHSLPFSLTLATVYTIIFFIGETTHINRRYGLPMRSKKGAGTSQLLRRCFPIFIATFLLFYIGNAPKYAIDARMDDASQAIYGFIAMPVFVIGLLSNFIFNPIIASLAAHWADRDIRGFRLCFIRQTAIIALITLICVVGAWLIGIPVLSVLYNTNLQQYRGDLIVLLCGGGFLALTTLYTTGITVVRLQNKLIHGYLVAALTMLVTSSPVVEAFGIDGASWLYLAVMTLLAIRFLWVFESGIRKALATTPRPIDSAQLTEEPVD